MLQDRLRVRHKVQFVASSLCSIVKDGRKYGLLPPVCARLPKMERSAICCHQFVLKDGKKSGLLPPVCAERWGEVRFVANKLSGGLRARGGQGHVLQQNSAVLFVRLQ